MSSDSRTPFAASRARRCAAGALALASLALAGCTDAAGYDLDVAMGKIPALATMREGVGFDPYEQGNRLPPPGSVPTGPPLGAAPPMFAQTALDSVAGTLTNPFPVTPELLEQGQRAYLTHCSVCHGPTGGGNGPVVGPGKFPFAPAINSSPTEGRADGYLYGVIRVGRGLMPAYGSRMSQAEMWATVAYLRRLQGAAEVASPPPAVSGVEPAGPALTDTLIAPSSAPTTGGTGGDTTGGQPRR